MPRIDILSHGIRAFCKTRPSDHDRSRRGTVAGWSSRSSRSLTDFLQTIDAHELPLYGYAITLTLKNCPDTPDDWAKLRRRYEKRLRRLGVELWTWLTEWQRRQVPHLHGMAYFPSPVDPDSLTCHWIQCAALYQPRPCSQHVRAVDRLTGWFEYLGKHAGRSAQNYQRSPALIPPGWKGQTGRMWGKSGLWPTIERKEIEVPWRVFWQFRRLETRYQAAKAKRQGDRRRSIYFKRYLSRMDPEYSYSGPLPRDWIPEDDSWKLLTLAYKLENEQS